MPAPSDSVSEESAPSAPPTPSYDSATVDVPSAPPRLQYQTSLRYARLQAAQAHQRSPRRHSSNNTSTDEATQYAEEHEPQRTFAVDLAASAALHALPEQHTSAFPSTWMPSPRAGGAGAPWSAARVPHSRSDVGASAQDSLSASKRVGFEPSVEKTRSRFAPPAIEGEVDGRHPLHSVGNHMSSSDGSDSSTPAPSAASPPHAEGYRIERGVGVDVDVEQAEHASVGESNSEGKADALSDNAVAAEVLRTLQSKDALIASLTQTLQDYQHDTHRDASDDAKRSARTPPRSHTSMGGPASSPSARTDAASVLEEQLRSREEELRTLREELSVAQQQWELKEVALTARDREARVYSSQIAKLELQVEDVLQAKKDDINTLKEHIGLLQRELHRKAKDVKEKERTHQAELRGLQSDIAELAVQVDAHVGTAQERKTLVDELAAAKQREEAMQFESQQMQRRWLRELEVQKRIVDELQQHTDKERASRTAGDQTAHRTAHENQLLREESQRLTVKYEGLQQLYDRAGREIQSLRLDTQELTDNVAQLTLDLQTAQAENALLRSKTQAQAAELVGVQEQLMEKDAAMRSAEHAHAEQLECFLQSENERQQSVLSQVGGCVASTEKLEDALRACDAHRRYAEQQVGQLQEEKLQLISTHRQVQAQRQQEALEQQKLSAEVEQCYREKLADAQSRLHELNERVAGLQRDKQVVEAELTSEQEARVQARELADATAAEQRRTAQSLSALGQQLLVTKEELRAALSAQLTATTQADRLAGRLEDSVQRRRALQQQLSTARAHEATLCRAVNESVALLKSLLAPARGAATASAVSSVEGGEHGIPPPDPSTVEIASQCSGRAGDGDDSGEDGAARVSLSSDASAVSPGQASSPSVAQGTSSAGFGAALRLLRAFKNSVASLRAQRRALEQQLAVSQARVLRLQTQLGRAEADQLEAKRAHAKEVAALNAAQTASLDEARRAAQARVQAAREDALATVEARLEQQEQQMAAHQQRSQTRLCATVAGELTRFMEQLPSLLHRTRATTLRADTVDAEQTPHDVSGAPQIHSPVPTADLLPRSAVGALTDASTWALSEPIEDGVRSECDVIVREMLGLAGGWQDLAALSAAPLPLPSAAHPVAKAPPAQLPQPVEERSFSSADLAQMRGLMEQYLLAKISSSHAESSSNDSVATSEGELPAATRVAAAAHKRTDASAPATSSTAPPDELPTVARSIRQWVAALRSHDVGSVARVGRAPRAPHTPRRAKESSSQQGNAPAAARAAIGAPKGRHVPDEKESSATMMVAELMKACTLYAAGLASA